MFRISFQKRQHLDNDVEICVGVLYFPLISKNKSLYSSSISETRLVPCHEVGLMEISPTRLNSFLNWYCYHHVTAIMAIDIDRYCIINTFALFKDPAKISVPIFRMWISVNMCLRRSHCFILRRKVLDHSTPLISVFGIYPSCNVTLIVCNIESLR